MSDAMDIEGRPAAAAAAASASAPTAAAAAYSSDDQQSESDNELTPLGQQIHQQQQQLVRKPSAPRRPSGPNKSKAPRKPRDPTKSRVGERERRKKRKLEEAEAAALGLPPPPRQGWPGAASYRPSPAMPFNQPVYNPNIVTGELHTNVSAYSSSAAMPSSSLPSGSRSGPNALREQVVVIVPGSDTLKIGFSEALRPKLVRQVLAYRVAESNPTSSYTTAPAVSEEKESAMNDGAERKDGEAASAAAAAPAISAASAFQTELERSDEEEEAAELRLLSHADKGLLLKWRKKRESDQLLVERQLRKRKGPLATSTASLEARASVSSSSGELRVITPQLNPQTNREESIHDPANQLDAPVLVQSSAPPSSAMERMSSLLRMQDSAATAAASATVAAVLAGSGLGGGKSTGPPRAVFASTLLAPPSIASPLASCGYLPRKPLSRGHFHLSSRCSVRHSIAQQEDLLRQALADCLGLQSKEDFRAHAVSLAVPDSWTQREVVEYVTLLLVTIGFREIFLHRESVLATYGAGLASACVVDLGAERSRITCVEDGCILPRASLELNFGGKHIEQLLETSVSDRVFWMKAEGARMASQTKPQADLLQLRQIEQVRKWKERYCYLLKTPAEGDEEEEDDASSDLPRSVPSELMLGAVIAPLGLFYPSLFHSNLSLRSSLHARRELHDPTSTLVSNLDPLADRFLASSAFAAPAEDARATVIASAGANFNRQTAFDTEVCVTVGGLEGSSAAVGAAGGGGGAGTASSKRRARKRMADDSNAAAAGGPSNAGATSSATASPAKSGPPPFRLDRRRKDHQALLLHFSEEQLMAGVHLEPASILKLKKMAEEEEAHAAAASASAAQGDATMAAAATSAAASAAAAAAAVAASSSLAAAAASASASDPPSLLDAAGLTPVESFLASRPGLHFAVCHVLSQLGGDLAQRNRMATSILLTGGSCKFPQLAEAFEDRLVDTVPYLVPGVNTVNCVLHPKGIDSAELSWRGAAILAKAESTRDMWMTSEEWKRYGAKLLREKAPFKW